MKLLTRFWIAAGLLLATGAGAQQAPDLSALYQQAVREAREQHRQREEQLLDMYRSHLDRLIAAAQPEGDIESIVIYLDEKENPGEGPMHDRLRASRASLRQQRESLAQRYRADRLRIERQYESALEQQVQTYTRNEELERAVAASNLLDEVRERIAAIAPEEDDDEEPAAANFRLGPEVITDGNLDDAEERHWRINSPGDRNRTGFHTESRQEAGGVRNKVLRFQQDERRGLHVRRNVRLQPNQEYLLTWRHRQQAPWRHGIELRGKGHYNIGVRIPTSVYSQFTLEQRRRIRRDARARITPPDSREWVQMERRIRTGPQMTEFFIDVSTGEGDFLIDDISLRPILPPE